MPTPVEIENMVVRIRGDSSDYVKHARAAARETRKVKDEVETSDNHLQFMSKRLNFMGLQLRGFGKDTAAAILPLLGIGSALSNVFRGVKLASEAEKMETAFGTTLRSVEKGQQLVKMIQKFAAETPLGTADLERSAKMLIQADVALENIIPTLRMLGDVASGDSQMLQRMTLAFTQMKRQGRVLGEELNQMMEAGFSPIQEMSRTTGKTTAELMKMKEAGQITFAMVERAFKSATSEGGAFFEGMKAQSKTLSGLFSTLNDDMDAFFRETGKTVIEMFKLKEILKEVSAAVQGVTEAWKAINPEVKAAVANVILVTTALGAVLASAFILKGTVVTLVGLFGGLAAPMFTIAGALKTIVGLSLLLLNPFKLVAGAVLLVKGLLAGVSLVIGAITSPLALILIPLTMLIAATVQWVDSVGGVAGAWELIKQKAMEFWEFIRPIRQALASLFGTMWEVAKQVFENIKAKFLEVVRGMLGGVTISWSEIRDFIVTAILLAEYALLNLDKTLMLVWRKAKYEAVRLANQIIYVFRDVIPALFKFVVDNWREILVTLVDGWVQFQTNLIINAGMIASSLPDLIFGDLTSEELFKRLVPMTTGMKNWIKGLPTIPDRVVGPLEQRLRDELDAAAREFGRGFEEFKNERLKMFNQRQVEEAAKEAGKAGESIGAEINKGITKETSKLDAALRYSAEAITRLENYRDLVKFEGGTHGGGAGMKPDKAPPAYQAGDYERFWAAPIPSMPAQPDPAATQNVLKDMLDVLRMIQKKPGLTVEPAKLPGP